MARKRRDENQPEPRRRNLPAAVYQLKVTLRGTRPPIWRRVQVPGDLTLADLHLVVQTVMGWENYHLYRFAFGEDNYGEPDPGSFLEPYMLNSARAVLQDLVRAEGSTFLYEYDFGDGWLHVIKVERILPPEEGVSYPVCLAGRRACPPEDCGGVSGYQNLLKIISDPAHEAYRETMQWLGEGYNPGRFDLDLVNEELLVMAGGRCH